MGVAYNGKALAMDEDVKLPIAAYSDMQINAATLRHVVQFRGSSGSEEG